MFALPSGSFLTEPIGELGRPQNYIDMRPSSTMTLYSCDPLIQDRLPSVSKSLTTKLFEKSLTHLLKAFERVPLRFEGFFPRIFSVSVDRQNE
jgi:hypothetical protein